MRKKLLILARGGLSSWSSYKPTPTCSFLSAPPKCVSVEPSDYVGPLNIKWRGFSYAASVPSETPNAQKGRKRLSRCERRAMVESFVNKYRAMNSGKFPTITDTMKQVGGSYYIVREIIQELKYKSNNMNENLLEKELFSESKLPATEAVKIAKDRPIQDDSQSVVLDDKETVDTGYEYLEEKRGPQTSTWGRFSKEVVITSTPGNHCIASESNPVERCSQEPFQSSLQMPNNVKTEEATSSYSDFVATENHLQKEEIKHVSTPFGENYGIGYGKAQGHESEVVDTENHLSTEGKSIEKASYEKREQATSDDLSEEPSCSSLQMPNIAKTEETMSSYSSDSVTPERHLLKDAIEHVSAQCVEKSGSSHSEAQSHDSEFVNLENHPIIEKKTFEKTEYERREQDGLEGLPGVDGQGHETERHQGSFKLDESKTDNSNDRKTTDAVVSKETTLWGSLKSFVDGIITFWRKS